MIGTFQYASIGEQLTNNMMIKATAQAAVKPIAAKTAIIQDLLYVPPTKRR